MVDTVADNANKEATLWRGCELNVPSSMFVSCLRRFHYVARSYEILDTSPRLTPSVAQYPNTRTRP